MTNNYRTNCILVVMLASLAAMALAAIGGIGPVPKQQQQRQSRSILQHIEIRQLKLCKVDQACYNCSRAVEEALLDQTFFEDELLDDLVEDPALMGIGLQQHQQQQQRTTNERLIFDAGKLVAETEQSSPTVKPNPKQLGRLCRIPRFQSIDQYCCQMWKAFDCRSQLAMDRCSFYSFLKYRKSMVNWANDLMLVNICSDFDYDSTKCRRQALYENGLAPQQHNHHHHPVHHHYLQRPKH